VEVLRDIDGRFVVQGFFAFIVRFNRAGLLFALQDVFIIEALNVDVAESFLALLAVGQRLECWGWSRRQLVFSFDGSD